MSVVQTLVAVLCLAYVFVGSPVAHPNQLVAAAVLQAWPAVQIYPQHSVQTFVVGGEQLLPPPAVVERFRYAPKSNISSPDLSVSVHAPTSR